MIEDVFSGQPLDLVAAAHGVTVPEVRRLWHSAAARAAVNRALEVTEAVYTTAAHQDALNTLDGARLINEVINGYDPKCHAQMRVEVAERAVERGNLGRGNGTATGATGINLMVPGDQMRLRLLAEITGRNSTGEDGVAARQKSAT
jgi:hypothetical protein